MRLSKLRSLEVTLGDILWAQETARGMISSVSICWSVCLLPQPVGGSLWARIWFLSAL